VIVPSISMEGMIVAEVLMSSSIKESETLDDMTLKHYMEMYKNPVTKDSMTAIINLTEVAQEKKAKKKDKKSKKKHKISEADASKT
jgi:hypothetical protein